MCYLSLLTITKSRLAEKVKQHTTSAGRPMIDVSAMTALMLLLMLLRMLRIVVTSTIHVEVDYFDARRAALVSIRPSYAEVFGEVDLDVDPTDGTVLVRHQPLVDTVLVE